MQMLVRISSHHTQKGIDSNHSFISTRFDTRCSLSSAEITERRSCPSHAANNDRLARIRIGGASKECIQEL